MHARRFRVFVDLGRLCDNLARADRRPATHDHARAFLADAGFEKLRTVPAPNVFLADEHALAHLEPDELRSVHALPTKVPAAAPAPAAPPGGAADKPARPERPHRTPPKARPSPW